ncbi:hypothetical protein KAX97_14385 [candidate division WOR-3 bacterium]|nr:hypothetical protein [candidate division WOR-3 bacterium]
MSDVEIVGFGKSARINMFLNVRVVNLFLVIEGHSLRESARMVDFHYLQSHKYLFYWEELGLVRIKKVKKSFQVKYTAKGKRVSDTLLASKIVLQNLGVQFVG